MDFHQAFLNNKYMNLPIYKHIKIKKYNREDLANLLHPDLNLRQPIVFHLKNLHVDIQMEIINILESYYSTLNLSYKYPYPLYLIAHLNPCLSNITIVSDEKDLPKFFSKKETRISTKESNIAEKNSLLQKELKNSVDFKTQDMINLLGENHKKVYLLEKEIKKYRKILDHLEKRKNHGR